MSLKERRGGLDKGKQVLKLGFQRCNSTDQNIGTFTIASKISKIPGTNVRHM
jgi:hypothetical protein